MMDDLSRTMAAARQARAQAMRLQLLALCDSFVAMLGIGPLGTERRAQGSGR